MRDHGGRIRHPGRSSGLVGSEARQAEIEPYCAAAIVPVTARPLQTLEERRFAMMSHRQGSTVLSAVGVAVLLAWPGQSLAQNTSTDVPPVIDIHHHAMDESFPGLGPMCPNTSAFTASDPSTEEAPFGWVREECTPKLYPSAQGEYVKDVVAEMERLNVTAVVFGDPESVQKWRDAAPNRVIPGTSFSQGLQPGARVPLEELRKSFTENGFKVMGEIGLQYEGLSPSDPSVDEYFALAEELDIPVAIHMGTGGSGRANIAMPSFRGSMGDPLLLEDLLARHPKLRVQVMHAGYPMIDNMLTLLQASSHVYVDVAGLIWSYPLKEVNRYIERLVDAGFEDRVMFGTDQMAWPKLMTYSISLIQNADYLTPRQKRDILYNNAARFLRLDASQSN
jgi:predicted TIM-barrel fold metal-dependent hydrolase